MEEKGLRIHKFQGHLGCASYWNFPFGRLFDVFHVLPGFLGV